MVEKQIFFDAEIGEQAQFLMNEGDAERLRLARILRRDFPAVEFDPAAVLLVDAAENVHGRRLAGPVLPDEAEDATAMQLQTDIAQHLYAEEALVEILDAQERLAHRVILSRARGDATRRSPPRRE